MRINHKIIFTAIVVVWTFAISREPAVSQRSGGSIPDSVLQLLIRAHESGTYSGIMHTEFNGEEKLRKTARKIIAVLPDVYIERFLPSDSSRSSRYEHEKMYSRRRLRKDRMPWQQHWIKQLNRLKQNFHGKIEEGEIIANRSTRKITLISNAPQGQKVQMWYDSETGVILKRAVSHSDASAGKPKYMAYFSEITYDETTPDLLSVKRQIARNVDKWPDSKQPTHIREFLTIEELRTHCPFAIKIPASFPNTYGLRRIRLIQRSDRTIAHLNYSDGIFSFSVFQSEGRPPDVILRMFGVKKIPPVRLFTERRGNTIIYYKQIPPLNITVVGNCDSSLLNQIIDEFSV